MQAARNHLTSARDGGRRRTDAGSSNDGGRRVHEHRCREAAATIKRVSLELGGNAPVLVFDDVSRVQGFHDLTVDDQKVVKARFHRLLGQPDTPAPAAKKKKGSKPKKKRPSAPAAAAGAKRKADDDAASPAKKAKPETLPVSPALFSPGTPGALGL